MSNDNVIQATLSNGQVLPLREYQSKAGNTCFGILGRKANGERYFSKYGVNVSQAIVGDHSKVKSVKVLNKTFQVEQDSNEKGQTVLRASGTVKVTGQEKQFSLRITVKDDGNYNISASVNGRRGGTGAPVLDEI